MSAPLSPQQFAEAYPPGQHSVPIEHVEAIKSWDDTDPRGVDVSHGIRNPLDVGVLSGYAHLEDGHHRLVGARRAGHTHVPVNVVDHG
jgi:hypothetical protein